MNIVVAADISSAVASFKQLKAELATAKDEQDKVWNALDRAISQNSSLVGQYEKAFEAATQKVKDLEGALANKTALVNQQRMTEEAKKLPAVINEATTATKAYSLSNTQLRVAFVDVARLATGTGFSVRSLGSQLALFGPVGTIAAAGLYLLVESLTKTSAEEQKAAAEAQHFQEVLQNLKSAGDISRDATASTQGDIAKVNALAAAVEDTARAYDERKRALTELQQINKSYFGDLSLENSSMQELAQRVQQYNNALVTQAIIKGQSDEIAKMSLELFKQVQVLDKYKTALEQARVESAKPRQTPRAQGAGYAASGGPDELNDQVLANLDAAQNKYEKQREAVLDLRTAIAQYNGELNNNIGIQLKQRPLQAIADPDTIKGVDGLLEKIKEIKAELAKPLEGPLFKLNQQSVDQDIAALFKGKIAEAIKEGAKIGTEESRAAAAELANLYAAELKKIQNPDLHARVQLGTITVTQSDLDKVGSKIEQALGGKEIKLKVPLDLSETIKNEGFGKAETETLLKKASEDALNNMPPVRWVAKIQLAIDVATLKENFQKELVDNLNKIVQGGATSSLANIGKAFGSALASGKNPLQAAGEEILGSIGGIVEQMGEGLIKYGAEMEIFRDIISAGLSLSPAAAIAVGIAMTAVGAAIKKSVKVPAFAEGGVVTGPTVGLIGEAGPEAIFPLSKINDFVNALPGQQSAPTIAGNFVLRGQDIVLAQQRAQKNINLVAKPAT